MAFYTDIRIVDLNVRDVIAIRQAAALLVDGFRIFWPHAWPDMDSALKEVKEALESDRIVRIAVVDDGTVLGWIGAIHQYHGHTWELHPLVVHPRFQKMGIGKRLVEDLEKQVRERGGSTIYLGTDDEAGMTTLANTDLYPNVVDHLTKITNLRGHPYEFYQKLGYTVVGVIPDAGGPGKPDIIMAKRIG